MGRADDLVQSYRHGAWRDCPRGDWHGRMGELVAMVGDLGPQLPQGPAINRQLARIAAAALDWLEAREEAG